MKLASRILIVAGVMLLAAALLRLAIDWPMYQVSYLRADANTITFCGIIGAGLLTVGLMMKPRQSEPEAKS